MRVLSTMGCQSSIERGPTVAATMIIHVCTTLIHHLWSLHVLRDPPYGSYRETSHSLAPSQLHTNKPLQCYMLLRDCSISILDALGAFSRAE